MKEAVYNSAGSDRLSIPRPGRSQFLVHTRTLSQSGVSPFPRRSFSERRSFDRDADTGTSSTRVRTWRTDNAYRHGWHSPVSTVNLYESWRSRNEFRRCCCRGCFDLGAARGRGGRPAAHDADGQRGVGQLSRDTRRRDRSREHAPIREGHVRERATGPWRAPVPQSLKRPRRRRAPIVRPTVRRSGSAAGSSSTGRPSHS